MVNLKQRDDPFLIDDWEVSVVMKRHNLDRGTALDRILHSERNCSYWEDETYIVKQYPLEGPMVWYQLLIRRKDMGKNLPWADKQAIKDQVVGKGWEAVELFPSEDRTFDTSNTYHLWAAPLIPIGYPKDHFK